MSHPASLYKKWSVYLSGIRQWWGRTGSRNYHPANGRFAVGSPPIGLLLREIKIALYFFYVWFFHSQPVHQLVQPEPFFRVEGRAFILFQHLIHPLVNRFIKFGIGFSVADTMERYLPVPGIDPTVGQAMLCGNKGILRLFGSESPALLWACIIRKNQTKYLSKPTDFLK